MHLKLPVYVKIVISFHNQQKNHIKIAFFRILGENLKISMFSAKICKIQFFTMTSSNRHCDVKRRATGTFWYQWKEETHTYPLVPKS